jgi:Meckel syndrome type 1 protein
LLVNAVINIQHPGRHVDTRVLILHHLCHILQFKVLAIGPLLEQMVDEFTYDGIMHSSVPFHEYTAANKLVTWVQQVPAKCHSSSLLATVYPWICVLDVVSLNIADCLFPSDVLYSQFTAAAIAKKSHKKVKAILSPGPGTALQRERAAAGTGGVAPGPQELNLGALPKEKRVIPSASLQLAPFYSEMDSTLYNKPILIALLSAYERKGTGRTKWKPRPPRSSKHVEEEDVGEFDRIVVKVYDVTGSAEFHHTVIIREYELLLADLEDAYHNRAHVYFQPTNPAWWATFIKSVLVIQPKPDGKMKLSISKKAIEQLVADGVEQAAPPPVLLRLLPKPEVASVMQQSTLASPVNASPPPKKKPANITVPPAASNLTKPPLSKKTLTDAIPSAKAKSTPAPTSVKAVAPRTPEGEVKVKQSKISAKVADASAASSKAAAPARSASPVANPAPSKPVSSKARAPVASSSSSKASAKAVTNVPAPVVSSGSQASTVSTKAPTAPAPVAATAAPAPRVVATPPAAAVAAAVTPVAVETAPAEAELDYNEDFKTGSLTERQGATDGAAVDGMPGGAEEPAAVPLVKPGTAGADYDEDFEEENSAGGTAATAEDANTANAVLSAADTYSLQDNTTPGGVVEVREGDNRYYSDFEENSLDNASGVMLDEASYNGVDAGRDGERAQLNEDPNRPLSAIEQAQREFDEIGEDDGVFFNSVDYDEDF